MAKAECCCGNLVAIVAGEPASVVACHCTECQRRTGSPFGVGAYYRVGQVSIAGDMTEYLRLASSGGFFRQFFCPRCGTTVYWRADKHPELIGIAVGAFADPHFQPPTRSVYERSRHDWVDLAVAHEHFPKGRI